MSGPVLPTLTFSWPKIGTVGDIEVNGIRNWKTDLKTNFLPNIDWFRYRVVIVSSLAHLNGRIYWRDLHFEKKDHKYDRIKAYTQSKYVFKIQKCIS